MNKVLAIVLLIITATAFFDGWVRFMAEYEEVIGMEEELRVYTPMVK
jgi:hypothetical protein